MKNDRGHMREEGEDGEEDEREGGAEAHVEERKRGTRDGEESD